MTTSLAPSLLLVYVKFLFGHLIMRRACKNGRIFGLPLHRQPRKWAAGRVTGPFSFLTLNITDHRLGPCPAQERWMGSDHAKWIPPPRSPNPVSSPPHTSEMRHDRHERIIDNILRSSQMLPRWRHHKSLSLLRELKQTEELRGGVHSSC
jgi:hypothetical protein